MVNIEILTETSILICIKNTFTATWPGLVVELFSYYTSTVNYTCLDGYYLSDGEEVAETICLANGSWSEMPVTCESKWIYKIRRGSKDEKF